MHNSSIELPFTLSEMFTNGGDAEITPPIAMVGGFITGTYVILEEYRRCQHETSGPSSWNHVKVKLSELKTLVDDYRSCAEFTSSKDGTLSYAINLGDTFIKGSYVLDGDGARRIYGSPRVGRIGSEDYWNLTIASEVVGTVRWLVSGILPWEDTIIYSGWIPEGDDDE